MESSANKPTQSTQFPLYGATTLYGATSSGLDVESDLSQSANFSGQSSSTTSQRLVRIHQKEGKSKLNLALQSSQSAVSQTEKMDKGFSKSYPGVSPTTKNLNPISKRGKENYSFDNICSRRTHSDLTQTRETSFTNKRQYTQDRETFTLKDRETFTLDAINMRTNSAGSIEDIGVFDINSILEEAVTELQKMDLANLSALRKMLPRHSFNLSQATTEGNQSFEETGAVDYEYDTQIPNSVEDENIDYEKITTNDLRTFCSMVLNAVSDYEKEHATPFTCRTTTRKAVVAAAAGGVQMLSVFGVSGHTNRLIQVNAALCSASLGAYNTANFTCPNWLRDLASYIGRYCCPSRNPQEHHNTSPVVYTDNKRAFLFYALSSILAITSPAQDAQNAQLGIKTMLGAGAATLPLSYIGMVGSWFVGFCLLFSFADHIVQGAISDFTDLRFIGFYREKEIAEIRKAAHILRALGFANEDPVETKEILSSLEKVESLTGIEARKIIAAVLGQSDDSFQKLIANIKASNSLSFFKIATEAKDGKISKDRLVQMLCSLRSCNSGNSQAAVTILQNLKLFSSIQEISVLIKRMERDALFAENVLRQLRGEELKISPSYRALQLSIKMAIRLGLIVFLGNNLLLVTSAHGFQKVFNPRNIPIIRCALPAGGTIPSAFLKTTAYAYYLQGFILSSSLMRPVTSIGHVASHFYQNPNVKTIKYLCQSTAAMTRREAGDNLLGYILAATLGLGLAASAFLYTFNLWDPATFASTLIRNVSNIAGCNMQTFIGTLPLVFFQAGGPEVGAIMLGLILIFAVIGGVAFRVAKDVSHKSLVTPSLPCGRRRLRIAEASSERTPLLANEQTSQRRLDSNGASYGSKESLNKREEDLVPV